MAYKKVGLPKLMLNKDHDASGITVQNLKIGILEKLRGAFNVSKRLRKIAPKLDTKVFAIGSGTKS